MSFTIIIQPISLYTSGDKLLFTVAKIDVKLYAFIIEKGDICLFIVNS